MAAAKRDRRRTDLAKFVETYRKLGAPEGSAFQQAIWVIVARNGSKEGATKAMEALRERFVDVNEFRVTKLTEIAPLIARHVKNDPQDVAYYAQGPLREIIRTQHQMALDFAEALTPDQLRKYLVSLDQFAQEVALVMALHFCQREIADEAATMQEVDGEMKPRKRLEREITVAANRLRMLFTFAAHGSIPSGAKDVNSSRAFLKNWTTVGPIPPRPKPAPEPIPTIELPEEEEKRSATRAKIAKAAASKRKTAKKAAKTKAAAASRPKAAPKKATKAAKTTKARPKPPRPPRKSTTRKSPAKKAVRKTGKSKTSSRAAGERKPRTTRTTRKRAVAKKSSRRS